LARQVVNTKYHIPALFKHCEVFYAELHRRSEVRQDEATGLDVRVFEGQSMETYLEVLGNGQRSNYSPVLKALRDMDCLDQLQRGHANTPSMYALHEAPTIEKFDEVVATPARLREQIPWRTMIERLQTAENNLAALEDKVTELETLVLRIGGRQLHDEKESTDGDSSSTPEAREGNTGGTDGDPADW
jgi:hypothetical protein